MSKRVYISADYSENSGDRDIVETLNQWGKDYLHKVDFVDMSKVVSGSVSKNPNCRPCDLKKEFNKQINASSVVIIVVGDKTGSRTAGSNCLRMDKERSECNCTPYKHNNNGTTTCKVYNISIPGKDDDVGEINSFSYIRHEFEQAKKRQKPIIVVYNSLRKETSWIPVYMSDYVSVAEPFWKKNSNGEKVGNYAYIKRALGYE